jgi:hypothetical protein
LPSFFGRIWYVSNADCDAHDEQVSGAGIVVGDDRQGCDLDMVDAVDFHVHLIVAVEVITVALCFVGSGWAMIRGGWLRHLVVISDQRGHISLLRMPS